VRSEVQILSPRLFCTGDITDGHFRPFVMSPVRFCPRTCSEPGKPLTSRTLIAQRHVNTLVVVHRRQLLDQWIDALRRFLGLSVKEIGQIGGGKRKPTMAVDVAMMQSLSQNGIVDDIVSVSLRCRYITSAFLKICRPLLQSVHALQPATARPVSTASDRTPA
jgi:hypothetical protein